MDSRSGTASPSESSEDVIYNRIKQFDKFEDESADTACQVDVLHAQIRAMGAIMPNQFSSLRALYQQGIDQIRREEKLSQLIVRDLDTLIHMRQSDATRGSSTPTRTPVKVTPKSAVTSPNTLKATTSSPKIYSATSSSRSSSFKAAAKKATISAYIDDNSAIKRKKVKEEDKSLGISLNKKQKTKILTTSKNDGALPRGRSVAAKEPKARNPDENYIIATVKSYNPQSKQYEVEDADETALERVFWVPQKHVLPIPKNREQAPPEFPSRSIVLAVYPQTTTFYKAEVVLPPSRTSTSDRSIEERGKYLLAFEDDGGAKRPAEIIHVLEFPKSR